MPGVVRSIELASAICRFWQISKEMPNQRLCCSYTCCIPMLWRELAGKWSVHNGPSALPEFRRRARNSLVGWQVRSQSQQKQLDIEKIGSLLSL